MQAAAGGGKRGGGAKKVATGPFEFNEVIFSGGLASAGAFRVRVFREVEGGWVILCESKKTKDQWKLELTAAMDYLSEESEEGLSLPDISIILALRDALALCIKDPKIEEKDPVLEASFSPDDSLQLELTITLPGSLLPLFIFPLPKIKVEEVAVVKARLADVEEELELVKKSMDETVFLTVSCSDNNIQHGQHIQWNGQEALLISESPDGVPHFGFNETKSSVTVHHPGVYQIQTFATGYTHSQGFSLCVNGSILGTCVGPVNINCYFQLTRLLFLQAGSSISVQCLFPNANSGWGLELLRVAAAGGGRWRTTFPN